MHTALHRWVQVWTSRPQKRQTKPTTGAGSRSSPGCAEQRVGGALCFITKLSRYGASPYAHQCVLRAPKAVSFLALASTKRPAATSARPPSAASAGPDHFRSTWVPVTMVSVSRWRNERFPICSPRFPTWQWELDGRPRVIQGWCRSSACSTAVAVPSEKRREIDTAFHVLSCCC